LVPVTGMNRGGLFPFGLWGQLRLYLRLMGDVRVPLSAKLPMVAALLYLLFPMDLLNDFLLPLFGLSDDALLLWLAWRWLLRRSPPVVVAEHRAVVFGRRT